MDTSDHQILKDLRTEYYGKIAEVHKLKNRIDELEEIIQNNCEHEWEYDDTERGGGRSWYICRKCGRYR